MMCHDIMPNSVNFLRCVMLRTSTVSSISNLFCIWVYACDMCDIEPFFHRRALMLAMIFVIS